MLDAAVGLYPSFIEFLHEIYQKQWKPPFLLWRFYYLYYPQKTTDDRFTLKNLQLLCIDQP